jgi:opacity protein-like surface antigen
MKTILAVLAVAIAIPAAAEDWGQRVSRINKREFESTSDTRARISAERYDTYQQRGQTAPLGGWDQQGQIESTPYGTYQPGYVQPYQTDGYANSYSREW